MIYHVMREAADVT